MATPTNHRVIIRTRFGTTITAPVVLVEKLGDGRAKVNVETNFHIEDGFDHPPTHTTTITPTATQQCGLCSCTALHSIGIRQ